MDTWRARRCPDTNMVCLPGKGESVCGTRTSLSRRVRLSSRHRPYRPERGREPWASLQPCMTPPSTAGRETPTPSTELGAPSTPGGSPTPKPAPTRAKTTGRAHAGHLLHLPHPGVSGLSLSPCPLGCCLPAAHPVNSPQLHWARARPRVL